MKDKVMEIISSYADIDPKKVDDDMTFFELDLDYDDIMELLIPIEEDFDLHDLADVFKTISVDTKLSKFISMIKELI